MVTSIPKLQVEHDRVCRGYALCKNTKGYFLGNNSRSKEILDLVHSNVCEPMTVSCLGGYMYYVTFIDDFSRKTWIYFIKTKDKVFNKFHEFKAKVDNLTERKIKFLRSDNGGEYAFKDFSDFCKEVGIKREQIIRYNCQ